MTMILAVSTEYLYFGWTGDVPSGAAEVTFVDVEDLPQGQTVAEALDNAQWLTAEIVPDSEHPLWEDAASSDASGDWYVAILIGSFGSGGTVLERADYQPAGRLTDEVEQPVRIFPSTVEVA